VKHFLTLGLKIVLALCAIGGLFLGLSYLGDFAGQQVAGDSRYLAPMAEVEFEAPPYIIKPAFLTEVRSISQLPEAISSVDANTPAVLRSAFLKHPWIAEVKEIVVTKEGKLHADLVFRKPMLAIRIADRQDYRAVDATGVLLPEAAPIGSLPVLLSVIERTETLPGQRHPDSKVVRAAELVAIHPAKTIERTQDGWRITEPGGKVLKIATP